MRATLAAACAVAALAMVGSASAGTAFGVADDTPKYAADGGARFFAEMDAAGLTEVRITVRWDADDPTRIVDGPFLNRMFPQAAAHRIRVVFSVYPERASGLTATPSATEDFIRFLGQLVRTYPSVKHYIVGNEFNKARFFQPQFRPDCGTFAATAYMGLLARSYDVLKAADPAITVISSVASRGNDSCRAPSNVSASPCRFIADMGTAFRALGRSRPAFDEWGLHAWPRYPTDPLMKGFQWPNAGIPNLDRIRQCLWDAFRDTAQHTFPSGARLGESLAVLRPLQLRLPEFGWQVGIVSTARHAYHGTENARVTDEASQARIYAQIVEYLDCDPTVGSASIFGLHDESDLRRFQAGLIRADGSRRPSFKAVAEALSEQRGCKRRVQAWQPATSVIGASAMFDAARGRKPKKQRFWGFHVTAEEDATYTAGVFRVNQRGATLRATVQRALADRVRPRSALSAAGTIKAYWSPLVRFPARPLRRGRYVYGVLIRAALNPSRLKLSLSPPFATGA